MEKPSTNETKNKESEEDNLSSVCCLKSCQYSGGTIISPQSQNFVNVRTGVKLSEPSSSASAIQWQRGGRATFHRSCWEQIVKQANSTARTLSAADKKAIKSAAETAEFHDAQDEIARKAQLFVEKLRTSKHLCVFTGAGISTAAGIGDYRGPSGKWTLEDHNNPELEEDLSEGVDYENLRPTYAHMALVKLHELGFLKYIISQNCDGLHLLSGFPADCLSELHGNVFIEQCSKCNRKVIRSFYVCDDSNEEDTCSKCHNNHFTGRQCPTRSCKGALQDTIINFGDDLPEEALDKAEEHSIQCDLMLSLGSSMTVTPACDLVRNASALCIVNRQKLPDWDSDADVRVFGDCDSFLKCVMLELLGSAAESEWAAEFSKLRKSFDKKRKRT